MTDSGNHDRIIAGTTDSGNHDGIIAGTTDSGNNDGIIAGMLIITLWIMKLSQLLH